MDVALENPVGSGTEGARRRKPLNLSGKRTEMLFRGFGREIGCLFQESRYLARLLFLC